MTMWKVFTALLSFVLCACVWEETDKSPTNESGEYLPLDDTEYPYAGLPRLVLETKDFKEIRDRDTPIPATMQVWGEKMPQGGIMGLSVKGRGNASFHAMPKYSLKIELSTSFPLLGMPSNKDWVLISNFADRTLLKNYLMLNLARSLTGTYQPRSQFVELFLNREYMGVYQLSESIKVSQKRIHLPDQAFLFEKTTPRSEVSFVTKRGNNFRIRHPKNFSEGLLEEHINRWEEYLYSAKISKTVVEKWLDIKSFVDIYWLEEFSKNRDGQFNRSLFYSWLPGKTIYSGPAWDFDVSFESNWEGRPKVTPAEWFIKNYGWYKQLFKDPESWEFACNEWRQNRAVFLLALDSLQSYAAMLEGAAKNEFKRWNSLNNTEFWGFKEPYSSYDEAVDSLQSWIRQRIAWIDEHI